MSSHSFSDITQSQWIKALRKLGLIVECKPGKGSHVLVKHPSTRAKYTIQYDLHKFINMKIFKKMMEWGFEEERIWDALK
ncbi:MAG: type II toxin-antitoxin system HicA family toxin [Candidatus Komeilibacteria bacterium]|nr:type II toxin-antitoxin system HicA family toxin [Candidatus Komeilibacteria bacterium]